MNKLLAPNGKPSNLNAKQYKLVRTPAFKKWFGDFENQYKSTLIKIVDGKLIYDGVDVGIFEITKKSDRVEIDRLYIDKEFQKKGIGKACIQYLFNNYEIDLVELYPHPYTQSFWLNNGVVNVREDGFFEIDNQKYSVSKVVDENGEPLVLWHYSKSLKDDSDKFYEFRMNQELGSHFGTFEQARTIKYNHKIEKKYKISPKEKTKEILDFRYYQVFLNLKKPLKMIDKGEFTGKQLLETLKLNIPEKQFNNLYDKYIKIFRKNKHHVSMEIANLLNFDGIVYLNRYENNAEINVIKELKSSSDEEFLKKVKTAEYSYITFKQNQIKLADGTNTTFDSDNPDIRFDKGGEVNTGLFSQIWEWFGIKF